MVVEYNTNNIQQIFKVDEDISTDYEHFSSPALLAKGNISGVNVIKNTDKCTEENSLMGDNTFESQIVLSSDDGIIWQKIVESISRRKEIMNKFKEASQQIRPMEFESYHEFFVLRTFKKGKSLGGHVDIEDIIRSKENKSHYYRRSKRNKRNLSVREPVSSPGSSSFSDEGADNNDDNDDNDDDDNDNDDNDANDDYDNYEDNKEMGKLSRKRGSITTIAGGVREKRRNAGSNTLNYEGKATVAANFRTGERRSTRLLNKANNNNGNSSSTSVTEDGGDENDSAILRDLYESIVPKVEQPYRRSDWVLPSRFRFTPDKQMRTKPEYEKVNLSDLISVEKIQRILSRFEGGLKGVRKTNWNSMS